MEIRVRVLCPDCQGVGIRYSPEWRQWWSKFWAEEKNQPLPLRFSQEFAKSNPEPAGPEEAPCGACNGTGYQEQWVSLALLRLAQASELSRLQKEASP